MSDYTNYAIQTRDGLKQWILRQLGHPLVTIELTDDHLEDVINESVETFTKYVKQDQQYLSLDCSTYNTSGGGFTLPDNVTSVWTLDDQGATSVGDINRLFSVPNTMANVGMLSVPYPGENWNWINYELAMQYLDLTKKMLGGGFQYEFNPRTHKLSLTPDPIKGGIKGWIVVSVYTIRPLEQQYGEEFVKRYALALAKIILGTVRSKFNGVQLIGGGTINSDIKSEGITEKEKLIEDLRLKEGPIFNFWVG